MSLTYAQLATAIQDYTENFEKSFVANIPTFVRQAEQRIYNLVQLPVQRQNSTATVTVGNRFLDTPSDFLSPYHMIFYNPSTGGQKFLLYKDLGWMREAFPDPTVTGMPSYYALFKQTSFMLSQTPDLAYTVELSYYYYPPSLVDVNPSTNTWLSANYDSVLLYGCLVEAYTYMKGEADLLTLYDTKFKEALSMLKTLSDGRDEQDTYRVQKTRQRVA